MNKNREDNIMNLFLILIGLIMCLMPFIFDYNLQLKIMQIASGIAFISNGVTENKLIKRIVAFTAFIVITYSYFKLDV